MGALRPPAAFLRLQRPHGGVWSRKGGGGRPGAITDDHVPPLPLPWAPHGGVRGRRGKKRVIRGKVAEIRSNASGKNRREAFAFGERAEGDRPKPTHAPLESMPRDDGLRRSTPGTGRVRRRRPRHAQEGGGGVPRIPSATLEWWLRPRHRARSAAPKKRPGEAAHRRIQPLDPRLASFTQPCGIMGREATGG